MSALVARTAVGLLAVSAVLATQAAVTPGSIASEPVDGRDTAQASAAVVSARFSGAIDTRDRAAVARAYRSRFGANLGTPIGWTGSNAKCRAGHMSAKARRATLESINFVRAMDGIAPVSFSRKLSTKAQKAALIMSANQALSHSPPRSWRCWTRAGHKAAGHSNLAYRSPRITAGRAIEQYMDDLGSGNRPVGHRRWVMYPPSYVMGNGMTSTTNALWVIGPRRLSRPNPAWVGWPTAGWFPSPLEPHGRWSLSSASDSADFSDARVRVTTASGAGRRVHVFPVQVGYGKPTLVFHVNNVANTGSYRVTVRGIKLPGRSAPVRHSYVVRLFDPRR